MALGILGLKKGMTQINDETKGRIAVTLVEAGPCVVIQKKTEANDGYNAIRVGFVDKKPKHTTKALQKQFEKANTACKQFIREFPVTAEELSKYEVGQAIKASEVFTEGQKIDISGTTKGKGFTGVMKRWGFKGAIRTHGTHEFFRHGGSIGMCAWPGRVIKNKKMAGQMGNTRTTTLNLQVVKILDDQNVLMIAGAVPGHKEGLLEIRQPVRSR